MEYEITNIIYAGPPIGNEDESVDQKITICIGVVGDIHGFVQKDPLIVTIPKTKTMVTGKAYVETKAQEYKDANYPDTI